MNLEQVQFTVSYQAAYKAAENDCLKNKIGYLMTEHLVFHCLLNTEFSTKLLNLISFDQLQGLKKSLKQYLDEYFPLLQVTEEELKWVSGSPISIGNFELELENQSQVVLYLSPLLTRIEEASQVVVPGQTQKVICIESFFVSLFLEEESFIAKILNKIGLTKEGLEKLFYLPINEDSKKESKDVIFKYCTNLYQQVVAKKTTILGRSKEINKIAEIFSRKEKNNVIISGPSGVGKSALVEKMITEMQNKNFLPLLNKSQVLSLDLGSLIAGTKFRGEFEERMDTLIKALISQKKNTVLVIENIHLVIGSGNSNGMDLAHFLQPVLNNQQVKVIGTSNQEAWRKIIEENKSFSRYFEKLDLEVLNEEDTLSVLEARTLELESHHRVSFDKKTYKNIVELSNKFLPKRVQPENSLDILDRAGAKVSLAMQQGKSNSNKVTLSVIQETISEIAKVSSLKVSEDEFKTILKLNQTLNKTVFGQSQAIEKLYQSILISKSGLREDKKTIGSFLFIGSTGVGKTEVAKCLADELNLPFMRFDMSEYSEPHSISKLIGSPAGYVGYGKGGVLSEAIEENPHSVVLIDELEKAHPEIYNLFLQIMDNGSFRDAQGRIINCQNIILIMTSNLGSRELGQRSVGLNSKNKDLDLKKLLQKDLKPEFLNRFDALINFNRLSETEFSMIFDKYILELNTLISKKNLKLEVDPEVKNSLIKESIAEDMGARPLKRLIESNLKQRLATKILEGASNKKIKVVLSNNQLEFIDDNL